MIQWLNREEEKAALIRRVLTALPDWFGIPEAIDEYVRDGAKMPLCAAIVEGEPVGLLCVKQTSACTAEVYVMGILPQHHRKGLGREMLAAAQDYARGMGMKLMQVKTLSPEKADPFYLQTHAFYLANGFMPLEVLPLWDAWNPCLVMVKTL